jgi:hypothetical protein
MSRTDSAAVNIRRLRTSKLRARKSSYLATMNNKFNFLRRNKSKRKAFKRLTKLNSKKAIAKSETFTTKLTKNKDSSLKK